MTPAEAAAAYNKKHYGEETRSGTSYYLGFLDGHAFAMSSPEVRDMFEFLGYAEAAFIYYDDPGHLKKCREVMDAFKRLAFAKQPGGS